MKFVHLTKESLVEQYQDKFLSIQVFLEALVLEIQKNEYFSTTIPEKDFSQVLFIKNGQNLIQRILLILEETFETSEEKFMKRLKTAESANRNLLMLNRLVQNFQVVLIIMEMIKSYHPTWIEVEQKLRCKMDVKGNHVYEAIAVQMSFMDNGDKFQKEIAAWKTEASKCFEFPETATAIIKKHSRVKIPQ